MMKRKLTVAQHKSNYNWKRWVFVVAVFGLCFGSLLLMQNQYVNIPRLSSSVVTLSSPPPIQCPKIAFLFIARDRMPLDMVWDAYFRKAEKENKFSIYVHSRPGFLFNKATTRSAYFLTQGDEHVHRAVQKDHDGCLDLISKDMCMTMCPSIIPKQAQKLSQKNATESLMELRWFPRLAE